MNITRVTRNLQAVAADDETHRRIVGLAMVMCEITDFASSRLDTAIESYHPRVHDLLNQVDWQDWLEEEFEPSYDYDLLILHGYDVSQWREDPQ